ncbi:MAG: hypothetical protein ACI9ES_002002, partial [Oceanospirillaceae bacterium]
MSHALSEFQKTHLAAPYNKHEVIYSPFDAQTKLGKTVFYGLPDEAQHLFNGNDLVASHVGRFCPMKGQLEVLMALNNLNKKGLK